MPTRMIKQRFEALSLGCRTQGSRSAYREVSFWSTTDEGIIGAIYYVEKADRFGGILLARDDLGRFQGLEQDLPYPTLRAAERAIFNRLAQLEATSIPVTPMRDDTKPGMDLFTVDHDGALNPKFLNLRDAPQSAAAKCLLEELARWFVDRDGNFVRDFQTSGFDARIWELYLFAAFRALDFGIDPDGAVPDFCLRRDDLTLFVEAVTANPTTQTEIDLAAGPAPPPVDFWHFIENDMPIKFGSPLFSKLKKEYWNKDPVIGHPFALAIADFHAPGSMVWSHTALPLYLYGMGVEKVRGPTGEMLAMPKPLAEHLAGEKKIPTNFFGQDDTQHVSAIVFSNAGTKAKFTRIGTLAGYGDPDVAVIRSGGMHNPEPGALEAIPFQHNIEDGIYEEDWADEIEVYHNPNAIHPWPDEHVLPEVTHFKEEDGELVWRGHPMRVLFSHTQSNLHRPGDKASKTQ